MPNSDPTGLDWSNEELDLILADYFDMLRLELSGQRFVKAQRNAELRRLTRRSRGSIEFKHQNISAVLQELGRPWIDGYKPRANYQAALLQRMEKLIMEIDRLPAVAAVGMLPRLTETADIYYEPPPILSLDTLPSRLPRQLLAKFDPAERDARNRILGRRGEEIVLASERSRLICEDRADLARKVLWVSEEIGDGAGHDILSFDRNGRERLIEVKTTVGHERTPFWLSENERSLSLERPQSFELVRLYNFAKVPRGFVLKPPLENSILLRPASYKASFESRGN